MSVAMEHDKDMPIVGILPEELAVEEEDSEPPKRQRPFRSTLRRLSRNQSAIVGLAIILAMLAAALFAPFLAPYAFDEQHLSDSLLQPGGNYPFGTDLYGRDVLSRMLYGARLSLLVGVGAASMGALLGVVIGLIAGYYGGSVDNVLMRLMDIILSIPGLLLAIAIAAMLGPGLLNATIAISAGQVAQFARIARASVLSVRSLEYVEAVRAIGASDFRIIRRHIVPNILAPLIVQFSLNIAMSILAGAGLSFIGLGIQPPVPEWGSMLSEGRAYIRSNWWLTVFPGAAIMVTVYGFNLLGDGLRDALDPRLRN